MNRAAKPLGALLLVATPLLAAALLAFAPLAAPVQAQQFGAYVAISDGQIMIAEPTNRRGPSTIYTYGLSGDGWEQIGTMLAPPPEGGGATSGARRCRYAQASGDGR